MTLTWYAESSPAMGPRSMSVVPAPTMSARAAIGASMVATTAQSSTRSAIVAGRGKTTPPPTGPVCRPRVAVERLSSLMEQLLPDGSTAPASAVLPRAPRERNRVRRAVEFGRGPVGGTRPLPRSRRRTSNCQMLWMTGIEDGQAATFSAGWMVLSSVIRMPSLNSMPASTSATSLWPLKRRQRSCAASSSL
jgi:hypothetical protein